MSRRVWLILLCLYAIAAAADIAFHLNEDRERGPGWLAPASRIYVERARREALPALPAAWQELRSGRAGEVGYHLFGAGGATPPGSETRT